MKSFLSSIFNSGGFVGGDWSFNITEKQVNELSKNIFYSWSDTASIFGNRESFLTSVPIKLTLKFVSLLGITQYSHFLLLLSFLFSLVFMYLLLRYLKLSRFISFFGGLFYVLTPVFFNYMLMGWIYVLFSYSLFPLISLLFIKAVELNRKYYTVIVGILYAISLQQ